MVYYDENTTFTLLMTIMLVLVQACSLSSDNLLLAGTVIRNTKHVFACCVYAGEMSGAMKLLYFDDLTCRDPDQDLAQLQDHEEQVLYSGAESEQVPDLHGGDPAHRDGRLHHPQLQPRLRVPPRHRHLPLQPLQVQCASIVTSQSYTSTRRIY